MPIKFDKNLYNKYDSLTKDVMSDWLLRNNYAMSYDGKTKTVFNITKKKDKLN